MDGTTKGFEQMNKIKVITINAKLIEAMNKNDKEAFDKWLKKEDE